MLTLNLVRHAKTEITSVSGSDHERELAPKGLSQSNVLGKHIRCQFIPLGHIFSSSSFRTQQTCSIILQHLGTKTPVEIDSNLYLAGRDALFQFLTQQHETTITLIGHNEGISDFATYLLDEDIQLRTAEFISMTFPFPSWNMISKGTASLNFRYRPQVFLPDSVMV